MTLYFKSCDRRPFDAELVAVWCWGVAAQFRKASAAICILVLDLLELQRGERVVDIAAADE